MAVQQQQQRSVATSNKAKKKGPPLRRGKWTPEEESYAARLIQEFKAGLLPLTDGTTLRTFLSKLLNCDPMRISKKFVGSNCIGKQVFRRRTADINRLTPEQIQQSRAELSELERRFLERVAQTNRVKNSGVTPAPAPATAPRPEVRDPDRLAAAAAPFSEFTNPPWLQPPAGYKHGMGAAFAASQLSNARAAAAGRALLANNQNSGSNSNFLSSLNSFQSNSTSNLLAAAVGGSSAALQQLARNASGMLCDTLRLTICSQYGIISFSTLAARLAGQLGNNNNSSMNSLNMLRTALSREQLSQLAQRQEAPSSGSFSNMRQNSLDALMSLDFQSLQSIDNLANLINNGNSMGNLPQAGLKNADFSQAPHQKQNDAPAQPQAALGEPPSQLTSLSQMQTFLQSLNSQNSLSSQQQQQPAQQQQQQSFEPATSPSSANLAQFLQSMQGGNSQNGSTGGNSSSNNNIGSVRGTPSSASLLAAAAASGNTQSALNLANLLRHDSQTGLSALRMQDGLNNRNSSVDDFLSLVAAGDIPHQDAALLNVPLLQQQQAAAVAGSDAAKQSFTNRSDASAAALAMAQARAASMVSEQGENGKKRGHDSLGGGFDQQGNHKR